MTNVSFVFLVGAVALLALADGRPSKPSFETEEYVISEIVKKGDINRKEQSPKAAEKTEAKKAKKKQFVIDATHEGPYKDTPSWGTTSEWPGFSTVNTPNPGHGFASTPGGGWNGYPSFGSYRSSIPSALTKRKKTEAKKAKKKQFVVDASHEGPYKDTPTYGTSPEWPGYSTVNTPNPGPGFASSTPGGGWTGYPSYGSSYRSSIPSALSKRWWPGYSGGWGGWGVGNTGYPGWGPGAGYGPFPGGPPPYGPYGGHGFFGGPGHGYYRSDIPQPDEVATKRWWPGYSGGWGGWGVGNTGYPGWGSGWAHAGWDHPGFFGMDGDHGFGGHGYYRSIIPQAPQTKSPMRRNFVEGFSPGVYGWGGITHGLHGPFGGHFGAFGAYGGHGGPYGPFGGHDGPYGHGGPYGPFGGHDGPYGHGGPYGPFDGHGGPYGPFGGHGGPYGPFGEHGGHDGPYWPFGGAHDGPYPYLGVEPFFGPYGHSMYGGSDHGGFFPPDHPQSYAGPLEYGPFGDHPIVLDRRHFSPLKQKPKQESAKSRQVIGYHPGCYGWGGVVHPGCGCAYDGGCGGNYGCGGGCVDYGCACDCQGCGFGCGGCADCRSKTPKKKTAKSKDEKAKTRQQIESPFEMLSGPSNELINMFNNAGLPTEQKETETSSLIPGIQEDITQQIEKSKNDFPEYSTQFASSDMGSDDSEEMQNFHFNPAGESNEMNLGDQSASQQEVEGNAFSLMSDQNSRRANIPKHLSSRTKKQSVAYPFPYLGGAQFPLLQTALAHPVLPAFQHLPLIPHVPIGYPSLLPHYPYPALFPSVRPAHNIHVGSPNVKVDVQTTRTHVAKKPETTKTLRRLVRDLEDVLEDETEKKQPQREKRQVFNLGPQAQVQTATPFQAAATRFLLPNVRRNPMVQMQAPMQFRSFSGVTPFPSMRAPYAMRQVMPAMQRSRTSDPPPLSQAQIAKMAGISIPLAIQPGSGLLGATINSRRKRTTKKNKPAPKSPKTQKRFFLAAPSAISGPLIPSMRIAPSLPQVAGFTAHAPPAIPLPIMRNQPQIAAMTAGSIPGQSRLSNYPSILSPMMHQPLSGYPVASLPSSNPPMVPPFFSASALPLKYSAPVAPVVRQQVAGMARQGIPFTQNPQSLIKNWFSSPLPQNQGFGRIEAADSNFQIPSNGPQLSMYGDGQATSEVPSIRNLASSFAPQMQRQQNPSALLQSAFGRKKSAVPSATLKKPKH